MNNWLSVIHLNQEVWFGPFTTKEELNRKYTELERLGFTGIVIVIGQEEVVTDQPISYQLEVA